MLLRSGQPRSWTSHLPMTTTLIKFRDIIQTTADDMRKSKEWSRDMIADADMWGMQHISGEQFVIRVSIRTLPNRQWAVSRELRKRCKQAFDKQNIGLLRAGKINMAK